MDPIPAPAKSRIGRPKKRGKHPTWEHPAKSGIKIAEVPNATGKSDARRVFGSSFRVIVPSKLTGGAREVRFFNNRANPEEARANAEKFAEDRWLTSRKLGQSFADIPPAMQQEAVVAWQKLVDAKLDDPATGGGFVKAVEAAIRYLRPAGGERTLGQVISELIASKTLRVSRGNLRQDTLDDFTSRTSKIAEVFGARPVSSITTAEIAAWLEGLSSVGHGNGPLSTTTVFNFRNRLRDVFAHAVEKRYCAESPMGRLTREEIGAYGGTKPRMARIDVLTPAEAAELLQAAVENPALGMLAPVVLRVFCGLRTAEVVRLDWKDVRWQESKPYVHLTGETTKTRDVRNVELCAAALEWLALCPVKQGPVSPVPPPRKGNQKPVPTDQWQCRQFTRLRDLVATAHAEAAKAAGVSPTATADERNWANITRHSFASYHLALSENSDKTMGQLGHSTNAMLFKFYRSLVTREAAELYFSLRPASGVSNVTEFPKTATA